MNENTIVTVVVGFVLPALATGIVSAWMIDDAKWLADDRKLGMAVTLGLLWPISAPVMIGRTVLRSLAILWRVIFPRKVELPKATARTIVPLWLLATLIAAPHNAHADCGEERAQVKLGKDADARKVVTDPTEATIAELVLRPRPGKTPERARAIDEHNTELTTLRVTATVTGYKLEADGDYHIVLADEHGQTMIAEIPDPGCAATGAWPQQILESRNAFRRILADHRNHSPTPKLQTVSIQMVLTGVGFFDKLHGQTGVAKNGIELHPVLSVEVAP